jgi:hypothetical protein
MPSVLSVRRCKTAWYSGDSYQALAAAFVANLSTTGLVRDGVVRNEVPSHDASGSVAGERITKAWQATAGCAREPRGWPGMRSLGYQAGFTG